MSPTTKQTARRPAPRGRAPRKGAMRILNDVLCGVDGTRTSYEAVRQAAALTGARGHLTLLAVSGESTVGRDHNAIDVATMSRVRVRQALNHARALAARQGVPADTAVDGRAKVAHALLDQAQSHSLLALGAPSMSRAAHLLLGGITSTAAHRLPTSLLIARRPPRGVAFAERVLVASDAGTDSDRLLDFGIALALEREGELLLLHAAGPESRFQPTRLGNQAERVGKALGNRGQVRIVPGRAERAIIEAAQQSSSSLAVMSSHHIKGPRALASVSERVVHDAPCSVLVVRPEDLRG